MQPYVTMPDGKQSNSAGMQWVWAYLRPLWMLGVVVIYAVPANSWSERSWYTIGGILYVATNLLHLSKVEHPRWPVVLHGIVWIETLAGVALCAYMLDANSSGPACLMLLPVYSTAAILCRDRWLQVILAISMVGMLVWSLHRTVSAVHGPFASVPTFPWLLIGLYAVILGFGLTMTQQLIVQLQEHGEIMDAMARLQTQSEQLNRVNEQVTEYANRVYDLAAADERNRIAGEIHDNVAHRLTALFVQLQAARRILDQGDRDSAMQNLQVCEELARESLNEVRQSVRAIRTTHDTEGIAALRRLALHYSSITGMEINFEAQVLDSVPPQVMALLYRVIQEGLTNAQRHGRATRVDLRLSRVGVFLRLEVEDNGRGANSPVLGFGLSTMRERLRRYGGDLEVESQPAQGFRLSLRLPVWEGVSV